MTHHRAVRVGITLWLALAPAILAAQEGPEARAPGVQADSIVPEVRERAASATVTELLRGRAAGLNVLESSGAVGATPRLWIRGPQSTLLRNDPLVVVDGVRVLSDPDALRLDIGGLEVSRLEDLAPDEIQSVRVLRGPAATARYGPEGAAGVLEIRTRGGTPRAEGPRIHAWSSLGVRQETTEYPASYGRPGSFGGGSTDHCSPQLQAGGFCTPTQPTATSFNALEANSPFRDGLATTAGVRLGGSAARGVVAYALSAGTEHAEGVLPNNSRDLRQVRGALSVERSGARLALTAGHARRESELPFGGGQLGDRIAGGLTGPGRETANGGYSELLIEEDAYSIGQQAEHTTLGGSLEWTALPWLTLGARGGQDQVEAQGEQRLVRNDYRDRAHDQRTRSHWGADATLRAGLPGGARGSLTGGFERLALDLDFLSRVEARGGFLAESRTTLELEQEALFARGSLQWRGVLLGGTVRRDRPASSADEAAERWSYSVGGEWSVAGASALPAWLDGLTVRAAHGGTERGLESLPWLPDLLANLAPGCTPCGPGAVERLMETEAGVDVRLSGRAELGLTGYYRLSEAVGEQPALAGGGVTNWGLEAQAAVRGGEGGAVEWRVDLSAAANRNRFTRLVDQSAGFFTRHRAGYPLGSYFVRPIIGYHDADGDGILAACRVEGPCEVQLGETAKYAGSSLPDHLGSVAGTARLRGRVTLYARADWQAGAEQLDFTSAMRCAVYHNCAVNYDPAAPMETQAAIVAHHQGSRVGFVHGADFVRLREVAVTLQAPASWTRRLGGAGVDLTFAGRNLALWTEYPGLDPETSGAGSSLFDVVDLFVHSPVRSLTTRIDVRF